MTHITIDRAVVEQALEALESLFSWQVDPERGQRCSAALMALRAALAQPEPEPVAWLTHLNGKRALWWERYVDDDGNANPNDRPLYTAPPQRKPLTEEEIMDIWNEEIVGLDYLPLIGLFTNAVRAVEAAHGIIDSEIQGDKA